MRIVGGLYRSRHIEMPKSAETRPTQDKVRQAVFNILQDVSGLSVLDLFAGSGAYGIEALSRGARHAAFVDANGQSIHAIKQNLLTLKADPAAYEVIRADALREIPRLHKEGKRYDLVFLDPPYRLDLAKKCLITLEAYDILAQSALVVAERFKHDGLPGDLATLVLLTERSYGNTVISIFRKRER